MRAGLALILIGAAWFGGWYAWGENRIRVPLDMPVSLAQGHIRTPEFKINVRTEYAIEVWMQREFDLDDQHSCTGWACPVDLGMSWLLWRDGRVVAHGKGSQWGRIGYFDGARGRYILDVDVPRDGTRFNAGAPHLVVIETGEDFARGDEYVSRSFATFVILAIVGMCMVVRSAISRRQEERDAFLRAYPLIQPGPLPGGDAGPRTAGTATVRMRHVAADARYIGDPRPARGRPLLGMSTIGLSTALIYLVIFIPVWTIHCWRTYAPKGLMIRVLRAELSVPRLPGIEPLLVRVEFAGEGAPARLFVNSEPVNREGFDTVLQKELKHRPPDWPVYVDGHPMLEWKDVATVVDRIRGLGAQVVLVKRKLDR